MKLNHRTFLAAAVLGGALALLVYYFALLSPVLEKQERLRTLVEKKQADLVEMQQMMAGWQERRCFEENIHTARAGKEKGFSLLSFVENSARQVGVEQNIKAIRPVQNGLTDEPKSGEGLEVVLEDIDTRQLVRMLEKIEGNRLLLAVRRIKVERNDLPDGIHRIRATIEIQSYY